MRRFITSALLLLVILSTGNFFTAEKIYNGYKPQVGDVIFQSLPHSKLVDAIEGVTDSAYSHCGIVDYRNGRWVVIEAYRKVEINPLVAFLLRGRDKGFCVYRLKPEYASSAKAMAAEASKYIGRPYDVRYRMDDEKIYCSELVTKAYKNATGHQLGKVVRFGDMDWQPWQDTIEHFESGPVPLDRLMVTPASLAAAPEFEKVVSFCLE